MLRLPSAADWLLENRANVEAVLLDIDGTLIAGGKTLPGSARLLDTLAELQIPYLLLTNDSNHSLAEKSGLLANAGLTIAQEAIVSCGLAIRCVVDDFGLQGQMAFVLGDLGVPNFAELAGLTVTRDPGELAKCRLIIVGEGDYDWQTAITAAINALMANPECLLVAPNPDSYWPAGNGKYGIGAGGKARFICQIVTDSGIRLEPLYLGKPYPVIYRYALEALADRLGAIPVPGRVLMLGDSLRADIQGGRNAGTLTGLVLSGITLERHLEAAEAGQRPDYVFNSLA